MAAKTTQPKKKSPAELLKERKIASYQDRITHDKEVITTMEEGRNALTNTNIVGLAVAHKLFGDGKITEQSQTAITVQFDFGPKRFIIPSAFVDGFLTTEDEEFNSKLSQYLNMGCQIKQAKEDIGVALRSIQILEKK